MDSKLAEAYEQLKEQRAQLTTRDNELERVNLKLEESETDNAGLKQSLESLETTRTELKKKLNETELLAQNLERQKEDLEAEVEVRNNTFFQYLALQSSQFCRFFLNHKSCTKTVITDCSSCSVLAKQRG